MPGRGTEEDGEFLVITGTLVIATLKYTAEGN